ncbi:MAG: SAM-dependent MidA family methyltransferase [Gammaproteobacteria bacterium]|jgi:SAM-dependent MidA family methyltransferase
MNNSQQDNSSLPNGWPVPDAIALQYSHKLAELITGEIEVNDGQISFERFMQMALYQPGIGYYSAGARKFGKDGDFTTAPEISSLYSACIARQCEQVFELTGSNTILELGAGSGAMASDILSDLRRRSNMPDTYLILETSADLRDRQQQRLHNDHPDFIDRIHWLDSLPTAHLNGVILANEVLDAMPVNRIKFDKDDVHELMVGHELNEFHWQYRLVSNELMMEVDSRLSRLKENFSDGYVTEINCLIPAFIHSLSEVIGSGAIFLLDYGYPRYEFYHPQRTEGTLICHYRHRSHDNPFIYLGNQDITAFIDFTSVAQCGHDYGLDVKGYSSQAGFLMSMGIEQVIKEYGDDSKNNTLILSQQAGQLLLPGQMGEKFKVMALTRNITTELDGFKLANTIHRL